MSLLFILVHWHRLAKLQQHTDHTLHMLDDLTTTLGNAFRSFVTNVCDQVATKELTCEYTACLQQQAKKQGTSKGNKSDGLAAANALGGHPNEPCGKSCSLRHNTCNTDAH